RDLAHNNPGEACNGREIELCQILAISVTMKRTVKVGAGVGDHLDLSNMKFRSWLLDLSRHLATKEIRDDRPPQSFVSNHDVIDRVAEIDELSFIHGRVWNDTHSPTWHIPLDTIRFSRMKATSAH